VKLGNLVFARQEVRSKVFGTACTTCELACAMNKINIVTYTGKDGLQHWEHRRTCIVVFILHESEHDGEDLLQQTGTFRSNLVSGSVLGVGSGQ
jgi:hypothetical protein